MDFAKAHKQINPLTSRHLNFGSHIKWSKWSHWGAERTTCFMLSCIKGLRAFWSIRL